MLVLVWLLNVLESVVTTKHILLLLCYRIASNKPTSKATSSQLGNRAVIHEGTYTRIYVFIVAATCYCTSLMITLTLKMTKLIRGYCWRFGSWLNIKSHRGIYSLQITNLIVMLHCSISNACKCSYVMQSVKFKSW